MLHCSKCNCCYHRLRRRTPTTNCAHRGRNTKGAKVTFAQTSQELATQQPVVGLADKALMVHERGYGPGWRWASFQNDTTAVVQGNGSTSGLRRSQLCIKTWRSPKTSLSLCPMIFHIMKHVQRMAPNIVFRGLLACGGGGRGGCLIGPHGHNKGLVPACREDQRKRGLSARVRFGVEACNAFALTTLIECVSWSTALPPFHCSQEQEHQ
jgi:hypothetical protein